MPKFAANLSMMFTELPFLERFRAASQAGFQAVEFQFPYEYNAADIAAQLKENHLQNVLFNMPPGDWAAGERGMSSIPGREAEFRDNVTKALSYATQLRTPHLHAMAGIFPASADRAQHRKTYIDNLRYACAEATKHDITIVIEPINTRDMPGFFLNTQAEAHAVCQEVGAPNIKIQMDLYHLQIVEGDMTMKLRHYLPWVGHIQIAGVPDRHEPDLGEVNYAYIFQLLDEIGYDGWVGCEYRPAKGTVEGLGWMSTLCR
jgi:hydroxypyruvate isomerase